jgi:minor histocompatibility antigen H13
MVTVAKGIDAPIKLLAPKTDKTFAMLGLGDVVIPGLLIALCLRFDLARRAKAYPKEDVGPRSSFSKPYFSAAIASYIAGLGATIAAMLHSGKAQPALLYLSPACIIGPLLTAATLGEVKEWWSWRDEEEEEKDETIEAASEVAMMARKEAKAKAAAEEAAAEQNGEKLNGFESAQDSAPDTAAQDDSWMDGAGVGGAEGPRTRSKRKGGKRK